MSALETIALVNASTSLITAVGVAYGIFVSKRNGRRLEEVRVQTNGMAAELNAQTARASRAEGKEEGREAERQK